MRVVRIAIIFTAVFWLIALTHQVTSLPHALQPRFTRDPFIGSSVTKYVVRSSIELLLFVTAAAVLSFYVYRTRRAWAAVALCALFGAAFWHYYIAGLGTLFRPPLGDGSWHGAAMGWLRLHSINMWLHITKLVLLLSCIGLWLAASYHISRGRKSEV